MSEVTYYFNARHATEVWTDPDNAVDNNLETYASTTVSLQVQRLITNTCPGDDLGTITKVEIRAYAYGDVDDLLVIRPEFTGGAGGDHNTVPGLTPAWGAYQDITSDANAPDWSLWSHIQDLDCDIQLTDVAKGNIMRVAKVEIRVTYTIPPPEAPTDLASPSQTETTIDLTWTKGANTDKTLIRFRDDQYPTGIEDGELAYFDTGESVTVEGSDKSIIQDATNASQPLYAGFYIRAGERVNAFPAANISRASFKLAKYGSPTGTAYVRIRKVSDDSILATIAEINIATGLTTTPTWYDFDCDVDNPTEQDLRFTVEYDGGSSSTYVDVALQTTDVLADAVYTRYTTSWIDSSSFDLTIKIYYFIPLEPATTYYFRAWGYQLATELYSEETADLTQATASGGVTHYGAATLAGVGTLAGIPHVTFIGKSTLSGTGTLAAIGRLIAVGKATLVGIGTLAAVGSFWRYASATLSGTGTLAAIAGVFKLGAATLAGAGTLASKGVVTVIGKVTLAGTGTLASIGRGIFIGKSTLSGTGTLAAIGRRIFTGSATLAGLGTLTANAVLTVIGKAVTSGVGTLSAIGTVIEGGVIKYGSALLSGVGTLTTSGVRVFQGAVTLAGSGTLAGIGHITAIGKATLSGVGTLAAIAGVFKLGAATLTGVGTLVASGVITAIGKATLSGTGTLSAIGRGIFVGAATLAGTGTLRVIGNLGRILRVVVVTTHYRAVNAITTTHRQVNSITTYYRKVKVATTHNRLVNAITTLYRKVKAITTGG